MKIVLATRRNVGMIALSWYVAKGYDVKVITDDVNVKWLAYTLGQKFTTLETMGEFDFFASVHWHKIIPKEYLDSRFFNVHPVLFKYRGTNPIKKYIANQDTEASVESHYMTEIPDDGKIISQEFFETPICETYSDFYNVAFPHYYKILEKTMEVLLK